MKLSFKAPFLSIRAFPGISLPSFTLLTGVNGSGKTHLLRAIAGGHIQSDIAPNPQQDTRFFDWTTLVPNEAGKADVTQLARDEEEAFTAISNARQKHSAQFESILAQIKLPQSLIANPWHVLALSIDELLAITETEQVGQQVFNQLRALERQSDQFLLRSLSDKPRSTRLQELARRRGRSITALDRADLDHFPLSWGRVDIFQQSFARMFLAYHNRYAANRLHAADASDGKQSFHFSNEDFIAQYGEPPWDFVNRVLREAGLDFVIDQPTGYSPISYTPRLTKVSSGASLSFTDLSSGEKVLMSLAFCLYYARDDREVMKRPKLLLFDEIDAPLHPSMARTMMRTVTDTLVLQCGISVVMATHSPSTVAVASEESLYVMRPNDAGIHKAGKRQAIALLTSEIPTLSISFHGRRQVFVESQLDAERYDALYTVLGPKIETERSLTFIAAGSRRANQGDDCAGCDQVRRIVTQLAKNGNESTFGLIDWDGKNTPCGRIHVLANKERYAVENCLLDPLLVGILAVREQPNIGVCLGLEPSDNYVILGDLPTRRLQALVDGVQGRVLASETDPVRRVSVSYVGGMDLDVAEAYVRMQGHLLVERIQDVFPFLKQFHNEGSLLRHIVETVIRDYPKFVPQALLAAFEWLVSVEVAD